MPTEIVNVVTSSVARLNNKRTVMHRHTVLQA